MILINCTQHDLPKEGLEVLEDCDVINFRDDNPELFGELSNMTGDEDLVQLAFDFRDYILLCHKRNGGSCIGVVLPIGSPAFMFEFAQHIQWIYDNTEAGSLEQYFMIFMFAHSERNVEEGEDGTKKVKFHFKKWITV